MLSTARGGDRDEPDGTAAALAPSLGHAASRASSLADAQVRARRRVDGQAAEASGRSRAASGPVGGRADRMPWLIAGGIFAVYGTYSLLLYEHFTPASWDLGIFTEYVRQYSLLHAPIVNVEAPGLNLLGDHFHPVVALLAPFFRLFPTPATLLVAQALLVAASVIPVCRAAEELLGTGESRAIGVAYGLSWGLQQLVRYDFHEVAFAVPLLAFSLSALVRGRHRAAVAWALPLVFVKEDQGLTVAAIGLLLAWRYRQPIAGALLAAWGFGWSLLAILVIIPHFNPQHAYSFWAKGGVLTPGSQGITPAAIMHQLVAGASVKLPTLALILLVTAFLAARSPVALVAVPGLALRFLSTDASFWGNAWHYNASVMPVVFIAAADAMAALRLAPSGHGRNAPEPGRLPGFARLPGSGRRLGALLERHGAALMIGICVALTFQFPLSGLWSPDTYRTGARQAAVQAALAVVPDNVTVASDLNLLAPLAARDNTYWLGTVGTTVTQYVVFDTQSADYHMAPGSVPTWVNSLHRGIRYRQVFTGGGILVFRRAAG